MNNYLEHEDLEDEINEEELVEDNDGIFQNNRINKLPASGSKKRWEKGQTSRLKSSIGESRLINITINNPNKMMILRCLYMSRSLDIFQIARVAVPDMNMEEYPFYYVNWEEVIDSGIWGLYKVPEKVKTSKNMSWKDVKP